MNITKIFMVIHTEDTTTFRILTFSVSGGSFNLHNVYPSQGLPRYLYLKDFFFKKTHNQQNSYYF